MVALTVEQFRSSCPKLTEEKAVAYLPMMMAACSEFGITTPLRLASWLAQAGHESGSFRYLQEIWGPTTAQLKYEPPSSVASKLGNIRPGDGYRFKGRGPIQVTGRYNYEKAGKALGMDLITHPELAADPIQAFRISAWWWKEHGCNEIADTGNMVALTRRINGGTNGLADREKRFDLACQVLGVTMPAPEIVIQKE
jgi:predicted chitinase